MDLQAANLTTNYKSGNKLIYEIIKKIQYSNSCLAQRRWVWASKESQETVIFGGNDKIASNFKQSL